MKAIEDLKIKIFSDGADRNDFIQLGKRPYIKGFTTNPTLMRKAGVQDYEAFIKDVLPLTEGKPVSFEVIADEFDEMERQAKKLSACGDNVYVKIPITNTKGEYSGELIRSLSTDGVKLNITAILTLDQVRQVVRALAPGNPAIVSVFAGRIADTGVDPVPIMKDAKKMLERTPAAELLWASPRELLNLFQAEEAGCDIITIQPAILNKIDLIGRDLRTLSLETVRMFSNDAIQSGFVLQA